MAIIYDIYEPIPENILPIPLIAAPPSWDPAPIALEPRSPTRDIPPVPTLLTKLRSFSGSLITFHVPVPAASAPLPNVFKT